MRRSLVRLAVGWVVAAALFRAVVALPEQCPPVSAASLRSAVSEAVGWFERNQRADGQWLYRYDTDDDRDLGGYNIVRHAGVTMSLYQAAAAGDLDALAVADEGTAYALDHLVEGDRWVAFHDGRGWVTTGASALLAAGLAERRVATGSDRYDDELTGLGRFLAGQVERGGTVAAYWDPATGEPVPDEHSPFFTGEAQWALARLHALFPTEGWDEPARRIGHYLATRRDDAEGWFPDISDHWAAYGLAEIVAWPDVDPAAPLTTDEVAYARRQAGIAGIQVRWESQRTDHWPNWWLRGHRALGAGVGTLGEQLTGLWHVARAEPRLSGLASPLEDRTLCTAGMLVDRQVDGGEAAEMADPDRARGAWLLGGITQMDDQQHAMSALLRTVPIAEASAAEGGGGGGGDGATVPSVPLVVLALVAVINPARLSGRTGGSDAARSSGARPAWWTGWAGRRRGPARSATVTGGTGLLAALAWWSAPLLEWLSVSEPTVRIGAGLVLLVTGVVDLVTRHRTAAATTGDADAGDADAGDADAGDADGRDVVGVGGPADALAVLLRAPVPVVALSVGADHGVVLVAVVAALALAATGVRAVRSAWLARAVGAVGVLAGVALAVDGIYDV